MERNMNLYCNPLNLDYGYQHYGNEWIMIDLGEAYRVGAVQLNIADVDVPVLKVDKSKKLGNPL